MTKRDDWTRGRHNGLPVCCIVTYLLLDKLGDWISPYQVYDAIDDLDYTFNVPNYRQCLFHRFIWKTWRPLMPCSCDLCYWPQSDEWVM